MDGSIWWLEHIKFDRTTFVGFNGRHLWTIPKCYGIETLTMDHNSHRNFTVNFLYNNVCICKWNMEYEVS